VAPVAQIHPCQFTTEARRDREAERLVIPSAARDLVVSVRSEARSVAAFGMTTTLSLRTSPFFLSVPSVPLW